MTTDPHHLLNAVLAISVFLLIISLWVGGVMLWAGNRAAKVKAVERRLNFERDYGSDRSREIHLWQDGKRISTQVPILSRPLPMLSRFDRHCERAGWRFGAGPMLALIGGSAVLTVAFTSIMTQNVFMGLAVGLAVVILTHLYLGAKATRREALFETQFVDAMELAARSLRAGHPLLGSFQLIAEEMAAPVSTVFEEMTQKHELGASMEECLRDASRTSPSADMKLFATSVAIQMRTGGNLADLIDRLAAVIRERMRLNRRVKVLTAQTQMSKRVLLALPFVMLVVLNLINPTYMRPLFVTATGQILLAIAVSGLALGAWTMNKLVALKY